MPYLLMKNMRQLTSKMFRKLECKAKNIFKKAFMNVCIFYTYDLLKFHQM